MNKRNDTPFYLLSWVGFLVATAGYVIGVIRLEADIQTKGFFSMAFFFAIFATFTLAKSIRDRAENEVLTSQN